MFCLGGTQIFVLLEIEIEMFSDIWKLLFWKR